jgi:hypothetical protein
MRLEYGEGLFAGRAGLYMFVNTLQLGLRRAGLERIGDAIERGLDVVELTLGGFIPFEELLRTTAHVFENPAECLATTVGEEQVAQPAEAHHRQWHRPFAHSESANTSARIFLPYLTPF